MHTGIGTTAKRVMPGADDLRAAADVLNAGEKVAILAGVGALHATDELIAVTETLGAGIAKALLGKMAVPTSCRSSPVRSACWAPCPAGT